MYTQQLSPMAYFPPAAQTFNSPIDVGSAYVIPPTGRVFSVRGDGTTVTNLDDQYTQFSTNMERRLYPSIALALVDCKANRGDTIIVYPGHTENVAKANAWPLVAGVKIVGLGGEGDRPTITWTVAASSVLMNAANVKLQNLNLFFCPAAGGGVTVTAPITISAAGCSILGGAIRMSTDATTLCTIGVTTTAGATDLTLSVPRVYGATAGTPTTGFQFVGATRLNLFGTSISMATSAVGVGVVRFLTTASTDIEVYDCVFRNNLASSTAAVTCMAGVTGEADCVSMKVNSGGATAWVTVAGMTFGPNVTACNTDGQRGVVFGTGSTLA
jgi:hypothetical protein